ncbi:MAG: hypothetical protein MUF21_10970, partial [Gemmatimonadaceae bacterium]|nr:hypothetical protein [Gemmatimonadaceae bacterium]
MPATPALPERTSARAPRVRRAPIILAVVHAAIATLAACRSGAPAPAPTSPAPRPAAAPAARPAVAVPPFTAARLDTPYDALAYALADLLATDLARVRTLQVVERTR